MSVIFAENIRREITAKPLMRRSRDESFFMQESSLSSHYTSSIAPVMPTLGFDIDRAIGAIQGRTGRMVFIAFLACRETGLLILASPRESSRSYSTLSWSETNPCHQLHHFRRKNSCVAETLGAKPARSLNQVFALQ